MSSKRYEVHEHLFIVGPRANGIRSKFSHSHEGGNTSHTHPDTGPSAYTIDSTEWLAATGMRGGGKKKFTAKPTGEQFETIPRVPQPFRVVIVGEPQSDGCTGPGEALPLRIASVFKMPFTVEDARPKKVAK